MLPMHRLDIVSIGKQSYGSNLGRYMETLSGKLESNWLEKSPHLEWPWEEGKWWERWLNVKGELSVFLNDYIMYGQHPDSLL